MLVFATQLLLYIKWEKEGAVSYKFTYLFFNLGIFTLESHLGSNHVFLWYMFILNSGHELGSSKL
jgi:hypothetical protein